jgi:hypothetical protein
VAQVTARVGVAVAASMLSMSASGSLRWRSMPVSHWRRASSSGVGREGGFAQQLAHQFDHRRQVSRLVVMLADTVCPLPPNAHLGLQLVQRVRDLLARHAGAALVDAGCQ